VPGLLLNVAKNIPHLEKLQIFELDRVFLKRESLWDTQPGSTKKLPVQPYHLCGALSAKQDMDFFDAKGVVVHLLESIGFHSSEIDFVLPEKCPAYLNSQESAAILVRKKFVGNVGVVAKRVADAFKIRQFVALFDIDFDVLATLPPQKPMYATLPKFPSVVRDLAVVVENTHSAKDLLGALKKTSPLLVDVSIFDVYRGKGIAPNARSLAFRMTYQDKNRTLTDQEVDEAKRRAEGELSKRFGAIVRA
jgi:phenylalanyl-tRNA synthetase beta chain